MYKRVTHMVVLSCKKATFLIEKQLHASLSPMERLQLHIHLSICNNCTTYKSKALLIDRLMVDQQLKEEVNNPFSEEEVTHLKKKITIAIRQSDEARRR